MYSVQYLVYSIPGIQYTDSVHWYSIIKETVMLRVDIMTGNAGFKPHYTPGTLFIVHYSRCTTLLERYTQGSNGVKMGVHRRSGGPDQSLFYTLHLIQYSTVQTVLCPVVLKYTHTGVISA